MRFTLSLKPAPEPARYRPVSAARQLRQLPTNPSGPPGNSSASSASATSGVDGRSTSCWPSGTTAPGSPVPDGRRDPVGQLTAAELDRYASPLARCLKALDTSAPIRSHVQHELATVRAEQDARASSSPADPPRRYDASGLTAGELDRTRRELAASPALARPDSPARGPILAHLAALDAELAARPGGSPGSPADLD